jgi:Fe-S cluster biogenesis protein NfuA
MDEAQKNDVIRICRDVLVPLVSVDGGRLHIVGFEGDEVWIHLTGTCSGCPGVTMTRDEVLTPALRTVLPQIKVVVTTGLPIPRGLENL